MEPNARKLRECRFRRSHGNQRRGRAKLLSGGVSNTIAAVAGVAAETPQWYSVGALKVFLRWMKLDSRQRGRREGSWLRGDDDVRYGSCLREGEGSADGNAGRPKRSPNAAVSTGLVSAGTGVCIRAPLAAMQIHSSFPRTRQLGFNDFCAHLSRLVLLAPNTRLLLWAENPCHTKMYCCQVPRIADGAVAGNVRLFRTRQPRQTTVASVTKAGRVTPSKFGGGTAVLDALEVGERGGSLELERLLSYLVGGSARCIIYPAWVRVN